VGGDCNSGGHPLTRDVPAGTSWNDSQIDRDIRRLKAALNDLSDVLVIGDGDYAHTAVLALNFRGGNPGWRASWASCSSTISSEPFSNASANHGPPDAHVARPAARVR